MSHGITGSGITFAFSSVTDLYWHPLAWLSHELDFELFGANPAWHHLTSIILHSITAALLFLVLLRFGARNWIAAAGSLLWALHPLRVESFAWVAERKDVLCGVFFIAAILAYFRYAERPSPLRYVSWLLAAMLALMSKPMAVTLPLILLFLDFWPLRRTERIWQLVKEKMPLFGIAIFVAFLTIYGQERSGSMSYLPDVPLSIRWENAAISLARYLGKMLWPVDLICFYPYDKHPTAIWVLAAAGLLSVITALAAFQRRRRPWLLAGWLWFCIALVPNIGLLQAGRQSVADRFTYLATMGLVVIFVFSVSEWVRDNSIRRNAAMISCGGIIVVMTAITWRQIGFWHDSVSLFQHAIAVEASDFIRGALATSFMSEHRYADAEPHLRVAIQLAPQRPEYHNELANVLLKTGRTQQAHEEASVALSLAPNDIPVAETMALILFRESDYRGTLRHFKHAVELGADPRPVATELNDMGASVASRGQPGEAEQLLRGAVELNPSLVQARRNLVLVLEDQGRLAEARAALDQTVRLTGARPEYSDLVSSHH